MFCRSASLLGDDRAAVDLGQSDHERVGSRSPSSGVNQCRVVAEHGADFMLDLLVDFDEELGAVVLDPLDELVVLPLELDLYFLGRSQIA
jgi:hypothetical protein